MARPATIPEGGEAPLPRTKRSAGRILLVTLSVVMTSVVAFGLAGMYLAAQGQSTLAHAIRPAASPLPPVQVNTSPWWTLQPGTRDWTDLSIRAQEVPMQADTAGGRSVPSGVATVYLDAGEARLDGDELVVSDGTVRVELGAQAIGTPLGLCSAFLSAFDDGSLAGAPEQRARLAGRLLAPEAAGDGGAAANAGSCVDASAAFAMDLRAGGGAASAVITEQDTSAAGRRLSENVPGDETDATTHWPGATPATGDELRFDAASMPLGLPPERIEARAHSLWLETEFDELRFSPRELAGGLTYSPHPQRG
ncbi:MAG TPA: hypothetical protein K8V11_02865 [Dietzia timorensis]|uniref:Uncharacterized protein n=1 Tax=Dietzia timorensis TaxID=499555 RepID=A0A921F4J0_9ACTN|nr:hypothetical protein [Dietzia timorensis]HJE89939.1 hypothetical protein [Dietzia timorensis]